MLITLRRAANELEDQHATSIQATADTKNSLGIGEKRAEHGGVS